LDTTNLKDLIEYVPSITDAKHILWGHVTTPLFDSSDYDRAIATYLLKITEGFDSLISVVEFNNFLLNKKGVVVNNTTSLPWPRTQDLETLYEINHAVFLTNIENYFINKNRIGDKPYLFVTDKLKSVDIDWEEDFKLAEILYEKNNRL
jgi:N-acylneuraminate cytidylyltransferase